MLKNFMLLRSYIATQMFIQSMVLSVVAAFVKIIVYQNFLDDLFPLIADLLCCLVISYICYCCHLSYLEYDVEVDNYRYRITSKHLFYDSSFYASILLALFYVFCYISDTWFNQHIPVHALVFLFGILSAPVFFLKLTFNFIKWSFGLVLRIVITSSEVGDMAKKDRQGELSVLEAFCRLEALKTINGIISEDFSFSMTFDEPHFTERIQKIFYTNGRTQEVVDEIYHKNDVAEKKAKMAATCLFIFLCGIMFYYGNKVAETRSAYKIPQKITQQITNSDWTNIADNLAYDKNTLSFDSKNSIIYCNVKFKIKQELHYFLVYMSYPSETVLWVETLKDGIVTSNSKVVLEENVGSKETVSTYLYNYFGGKFGIYDRKKKEYDMLGGKKEQFDILGYHNNKLKKEIKEMNTPKYIVHNHTGSTKVFAKGSLALVAENVKIKCYISPSFSRSTEVVISELPLEMRVIKIKDSRPLDYGGKAKLLKEIHITKEEEENNPTKIHTVPKDSMIAVKLKFLDDNEYGCLVPIEGKTVSVALKDDMFTPIVRHNWYRVDLPNNLSGWIDGKYLTEVTINPDYIPTN